MAPNYIVNKLHLSQGCVQDISVSSLVSVESVSFYKIYVPSVVAGLHFFYTQGNPSVSYVKLQQVFMEQVWNWGYCYYQCLFFM